MLGSIPLIMVIIGVILFGGLLACIIVVRQLTRKLRTFMKGKDGGSLEATLAWLTHKTAAIDDTLEAHKEALEMIDKRVKRSIRGYSLVRYDAYETVGGEQSFASGLIDEHEDGYILSIITNRNHTGIYAKKVNRGIPDQTLTSQETDALTAAKKSLR